MCLTPRECESEAGLEGVGCALARSEAGLPDLRNISAGSAQRVEHINRTSTPKLLVGYRLDEAGLPNDHSTARNKQPSLVLALYS